MLEDDANNIRQRQQESKTTKEMELMYLQLLSEEIWRASLLEGFKLPYLDKFDWCNDPYEHVAFNNT